jgi:hypothetical protein
MMAPFPSAGRQSGTWVSSYLGLPYAQNGRDRSGIDCWGIVRLVLAEQAGLLLPDYGEVDGLDLLAVARAMRQQSQAGPWQPVERIADRPFDVVWLRAVSRDGERLVNLPSHCGIVTRPGFMLHIERATDSAMVPYRAGAGVLPHPRIVHRVLGVYRHEALA